VRVTTDEQFWTVVRYIAVNPVAAGLCSDPLEWRWSSHAALVAGRSPSWLDAPRLMEYFAAAGGDPRVRYVQLTAPGTVPGLSGEVDPAESARLAGDQAE
jgi:hypothetical protein